MIIEEDLIGAIRQQAEAHPTRLYVASLDGDTTCEYTPNTLNPLFGCIVGEALAALGVPRRRLESLNNLGDWGSGRFGFAEVLSDLVADGALRSVWVARAQNSQDEGGTWAEAVEAADAATRPAEDPDYVDAGDWDEPW